MNGIMYQMEKEERFVRWRKRKIGSVVSKGERKDIGKKRRFARKEVRKGKWRVFE